MDTNLFQTLAVSLLGAIALLLIVALALLARIRGAIVARPAAAEQSMGTTTAAPEAGAGAAFAAAEPEARPAPEPSPAEAEERSAAEARPPQQEEVPQQEAPQAEQPAAEQERVDTESSDFTWTPAATQDEPVGVGAGAGGYDLLQAEPRPAEDTGGASARAAERAQEPAAETASGLDDEPQEQPFERDGRWWFRRGEELLVYDEPTGQWMPAPGPRAGMTGPAVETSGGRAAVATETRTAAFSEHERSGETVTGGQEASSGFWKCPACGAVNGSTATSCRMCFSARPS
ncbi:MAG: Ran-binding zinc finger domain-containing protein [Actinomycetota bacterium]